MSLLISDSSLLGGLPLPVPPKMKPVRMIPEENRANWCFELGNQAMNDGFWALARGCYHTCISRYGDQLAMRYNLALCEIATGRPEQAVQHLIRAQQLSPEDGDVMERLGELALIEQQWNCLDWFEPGLARDDELCLEPLQERHLPAMLWQFRDPDIARRANLPAMNSRSDVEAWWQEEQEKENSHSYAVMHRDLGFSGICGVNIAEQDAYFYFWMGTDCQGKGLGPRATALTLKQMRKLGVQALYTAVYPDNQHSQSALEKSGFERMSAEGRARDREVWFYGCGLTDGWSAEMSEQDLQGVLDGVESGFLVV